jgi:hypothetical protein
MQAHIIDVKSPNLLLLEFSCEAFLPRTEDRQMRAPLTERSESQLGNDLETLIEIEKKVGDLSGQYPGPGWDSVFDMLKRDREELCNEIRSRQR